MGVNVSIDVWFNTVAARRDLIQFRQATKELRSGLGIASGAARQMEKELQQLSNEARISTERVSLMTGEGKKFAIGMARAELVREQNAMTERELIDIYKEGIIIAEERGMVEAEMTEEFLFNAGQRSLAAKAEFEMQAEQAKLFKQELMNLSISMFVVGITLTQTLSTMEEMAGKGTLLGNTFHEIGMAVKFILGPMQVLTALMQLQMAAGMAAVGKTAIFGLGAFTGLFLIWKALTSEGKEMRAILGALGTALLIYAGYLAIVTAKEWSNTIAKIVNMSVSTMGTALPVLLLAAGAGLAAGLALYASAPKGQTMPGFARPVTDTGMFWAHKGEWVGRIGGARPADGGYGDTYINVELQSGTIATPGIPEAIGDEVEIAVARGLEQKGGASPFS